MNPVSQKKKEDENQAVFAMKFITHLNHPSLCFPKWAHILPNATHVANRANTPKNSYFKTSNNFETWHIHIAHPYIYMYFVAKIKIYHENDKVQDKCGT